MPRMDVNDRLQALRELLQHEGTSTQEELRGELERLDFVVNQSTISRDLRRLGAVKRNDADGRTTYQLPEDPPPSQIIPQLAALIQSVQHNGTLIVVRTDAGSASLVARQLDTLKLPNILGTIAGDDTVLVVPASTSRIASLAKQIESSI